MKTIAIIKLPSYQVNRFLLISIFFFLQMSSFANQSDTLSLEQIILKSSLINQNNPALTVSEISYDEYEIRPVNFQDAIVKVLLKSVQL